MWHFNWTFTKKNFFCNFLNSFKMTLFPNFFKFAQNQFWRVYLKVSRKQTFYYKIINNPFISSMSFLYHILFQKCNNHNYIMWCHNNVIMAFHYDWKFGFSGKTITLNMKCIWKVVKINNNEMKHFFRLSYNQNICKYFKLALLNI